MANRQLESAFESYLRQHPYLIDPLFKKARLISQQEVLKKGRYRLDLSFLLRGVLVILELKAGRLVAADVDQLLGYIEEKKKDLNATRAGKKAGRSACQGYLIGERPERLAETGIKGMDLRGHQIVLRFWDDDIPRPEAAAICEKCQLVFALRAGCCSHCQHPDWRPFLGRL